MLTKHRPVDAAGRGGRQGAAGSAAALPQIKGEGWPREGVPGHESGSGPRH